MKYTDIIEEIFGEGSREETTGAHVVSNFISGLSLITKIRELREKISSTDFVTMIRTGFSSLLSSVKKTKLAQRLAILGVAGAMILTASGCLRKNAKNDETITTTSIIEENNEEPLIPKTSSFNILLNASDSEKQRTVLSSVGNFLADFNIRFARPIADTVTINEGTQEEKNITIKPALTWDEAMAMTLVYNNFSKDELIEILNGAEIDATSLSNAYRMAVLQLMGAHVLETSTNPIKLDTLLQSEEAKSFYEKYHTMFIKCKETTGDERLKNVQDFYDELAKDFPITAEVREEGIAHSDPRATIEPYKFSIIPMVSAAEIMFQNLEIDYTLSQEAIDYLNDIGACNIADGILEKAALVSLTTASSENYADYAAVEEALIEFLKHENAYFVDDAHRELSNLPAFQAAVNGFVLEPFTYTVESTYTVTEEYTVTDTTKTSDRDKAVDLAGEEAVSDAEKEAQDKLDQENQAAKDEAESEADRIADDMQKEEDAKKDELQQQVDKDNQDLQDNIDNANEEINNGGTVNEDDLGHGADFDDSHSDSNGNLDNSVGNITTDGTGAVSPDTPLPDPNAQSYTESYSYTIEPIIESEQNQSADIYEYEEPYTFSSAAEIDAYVESLAAHPSTTNESAIQYHI